MQHLAEWEATENGWRLPRQVLEHHLPGAMPLWMGMLGRYSSTMQQGWPVNRCRHRGVLPQRHLSQPMPSSSKGLPLASQKKGCRNHLLSTHRAAVANPQGQGNRGLSHLKPCIHPPISNKHKGKHLGAFSWPTMANANMAKPANMLMIEVNWRARLPTLTKIHKLSKALSQGVRCTPTPWVRPPSVRSSGTLRGQERAALKVQTAPGGTPRNNKQSGSSMSFRGMILSKTNALQGTTHARSWRNIET